MAHLQAFPTRWRAVMARQRRDQFEAVLPEGERFTANLRRENEDVQRHFT